jgi:hypothetical protein
MQKVKIGKIRRHFEVKFDDAFEKMHTMSRIGKATPEQMDVGLQLAFAQGVLKAIDLIVETLEDS